MNKKLTEITEINANDPATLKEIHTIMKTVAAVLNAAEVSMDTRNKALTSIALKLFADRIAADVGEDVVIIDNGSFN